MTRHHMTEALKENRDVDIEENILLLQCLPPIIMKVLLLLALATVGQCALLGSKKCTYGPSYWCSHIHHAKECNTMQHCMTTVWKYQQTGMVGLTETCFDIIKVLDVVRHASEKEFLEKWAVGCTGMPTEQRHICKELMKDDMKEVAMLLKSDLPTTQIAAALNLCGGFADHVPRPQEKVSRDYCQDCVNFIGDLREIFNNSEAKAEAFFKEKVCSRLGSLEALCNELMDQYSAMIFQILYEKLDPHALCRLFKMCANMTHADLVQDLKYMLSKKQKSAAACDVCKSLAKDLQSALRDPTLQSDITNALKNNVCPILGSLANECKTYVDTYAPVVFEILVGELDPQTLCQTLGLCNATKSDGDKLVHVPLLSSPIGAVHILPPGHDDNSIECEVCEKLVQMVEAEVKQNKTIEEIKEAMDKICKLLPSAESEKCQEYVDKYGNIIINLLISEASPEKICAILGVCNTKLLMGMKPKPRVQSSEECQVCQMVFGFIQQEVNSSQARAYIKQIVDKVCTVVPSGYKQLCELFINEYEPQLFDMILKAINPSQICTEMKLCDETVSIAKSHPLKFLPMVELRGARRHP